MPGFVRATVDTLSIDDFTFDLDLIPRSFPGLVRVHLRWLDSLNNYTVALDGDSGTLEKRSVIGAGGREDTILARFACTLVPDAGCEFKFRVVRHTLEGWYRGAQGTSDWTPLFSVADGDPLPHGSVGLGCADGARAGFDNVLVARVSATGIDTAGDDRPRGAGSRLRMFASPNPFRGNTVIAFDLLRRGTVTVSVYDVRGRLVRRIPAGPLPAGLHRIDWNGRDERGAPAPSGVYFCRVETGWSSAVRKIVRAR
jgi:hypothetical protein